MMTSAKISCTPVRIGRSVVRCAMTSMLIFFAGATGAYANGSGSGYIIGVNTEGSSGKYQTNGGHTNASSCASSGRWAIDITTPAGQAMWSTTLTAYSQNKAVTVGGTGTCTVWPDSETVSWIQLP